MKVVFIWDFEDKGLEGDADDTVKQLQGIIEKINEAKQSPGIASLAFKITPNNIEVSFLPHPGYEVPDEAGVTQ